MILDNVPWFPVHYTGKAMTRRQCKCLSVLHMDHGICASSLRIFLPQQQSPPQISVWLLKREKGLTAHPLSLNSALAFPDLDAASILSDD